MPAQMTAFFAEPVITTTDPEGGRLDAADNILLVVVDSMRADTVGADRHKSLPPLFPTMEKLVADGTNFRRAYTVGNQTRLSTFAFLSGQSPRYGRFYSWEWDLSPQQRSRFHAANPPLLARVLRKAGYRTAAIGKSHLQAFTSVPAYERVNPATIGPIQEARWLDGKHVVFGKVVSKEVRADVTWCRA